MAERFESKVDRNGPTLDPELGSCHIWIAGRFDDGYGGFAIERKTKKAHRVAWDLAHPEDPVQDDEVVCHRCDNPPCVRAEHLFKGSNNDNSADMVAKGRSFHPRGHLQGAAKLTWEQVRLIRKMENYFSVTDIADAFSISRAQVRRIFRKECWNE